MSKITLDNLSDNLKAYLEGLGLSEEQVLNLINENGLDEEELKAMLKDTMSINELNTNSKTVIGAINELFQSANNGKELIASAIGEPVSAEDTFSAMSNDINSLLSTFKTNMMNNGVAVESSDRFKSLIDKIATLADSEGKGIQFTEGTFTITGNKSNYTVNMNLSFSPTYVFANIQNAIHISGAWSNGTVGYVSNLSKFGGDKDPIVMSNVSSESFTISVTSSDIWSNGFANGTYSWYAIGVGEEDTTLRDSLASILEDEGVSVTEEDDMANLISKVDEEFDDMKQEIYNALKDKGLDVGSSDNFDAIINELSKRGFWCSVSVPGEENIPEWYDLDGTIDSQVTKSYTFDYIDTCISCANYGHYNGEAVTLDNAIWCMGGNAHDASGFAKNTMYNTHKMYDPKTNTWVSKASLRRKKSVTCAAVVNNLIYALCGWDSSNNVYNDVDVYDKNTNTWTYKNDATINASQGNCAVVNNIVYVGGICNPSLGTNAGKAFVTYNPSTDTWTAKADLPKRRCGAGICAYQNKIYAINGYDPASSSNDQASTYCYDIATNTWTTKTGGYGTYTCITDGVVELNGKLYCFGDNSVLLDSGSAGSDDYQGNRRIYNPSTDTWEYVSYKFDHYEESTAVVCDGKIFIIEVSMLCYLPK